MYCKSSKYLGFTLVEMLLVIGIIVILLGMSFAAYQNMQTTIRLNEYANNLEQAVRKVQRDAMLLEKKPDENWVYGLGIDLTQMRKEATLGEYKTFKWCSGFGDYGDNIKTISIIPNFDPSKDLDIYDRNGHLPEDRTIQESTSGCLGTNELRKYNLFGDGGVGTRIDTKPPKSTITFSGLPYFNNKLGNSSMAGYIFFEAVTGRTFFYSDDRGFILNTDEKGKPLLEANNLEIRIKPARGGAGKKITIFNLSGRVLVEANDK